MAKAGLTVTGVQKFNNRLRDLAAKHGQGRPVVVVGYASKYALAVHEDRDMKWKGLSRDPRKRRIEMGGDPAKARPRPRKRNPKGLFWDPQGKGKSKFLEDPARRLQSELATIVMTALMAGATFATAMLRAGLRLQRESMQEVPVDIGNLKASAFTRLEFESFTMADARSEMGVPEPAPK